MYHHVVMFKFNKGTNIRRMVCLLEGLKEIPEVEHVEVRRTDKDHVVFGSADLLLKVTLANKDAYGRYDKALYHVNRVKKVLDKHLPELHRTIQPGRWAVDYSD